MDGFTHASGIASSGSQPGRSAREDGGIPKDGRSPGPEQSEPGLELPPEGPDLTWSDPINSQPAPTVCNQPCLLDRLIGATSRDRPSSSRESSRPGSTGLRRE